MAKRRSLVYQHLENVSGDVLDEYQDIIRDCVRGRQGVYALYRRVEPGYDMMTPDKQEAVRRQVEQALELWSTHGDGK